MNLDESRETLGVSVDDVAAIRRSKDPNWVVRGFVAVIVAGTSAIAGLLIGSTAPDSPYPYAAAISLASGSLRKTRIPLLFVVVLAALSFVSFSIGVYASDPNFGVVTYYGSYSQKS